MAYNELIYEVLDHVATITLNRPGKMNAWTMSLDAEYREALEEARKDNDVRVIIVTGSGRAFCAGADMGLLASAQDGSLGMDEDGIEALAFGVDGVRPDFRMPYSFPVGIGKPIIAAINGFAMGLGLVHALFCDIRIASDQAQLSTLFARRGLIAEHGMAWILPRLTGLGNALDLLISGRTVDAEEACRLGLVSRVVPHAELTSAAREYALQIATQCSPRSTAVIKRQTWDASLTDLVQATRLANQEMFESFKSSDFSEALMAFFQKRPAEFTGE